MDRSPGTEAGWFDSMRERYGESPIHQLFGFVLQTVGPGEATVALTPPPETRNLYGGVHGGILNSAIDSAVLQAVRSQVDPEAHLTTVELKVNFLQPAMGDTFTCAGQALRVGRSVGVAEAKLRDQAGALLAVGLGTIHIRRRPGV